MDMQPEIGSSSCALMILWTTLSGVVLYVLSSKLGWQFVLYGVVIGVVSGEVGQCLIVA